MNITIPKKIESINVASLIPYAANSRTHSDAQVAQIASSIREFGFTNPVLIDGENGIIAGHGRLLAARKLEMETVPCLRLGHLSESQRRAYVIADNKLALNAGWDEAMLKAELDRLVADGFDIELTGFDAGEIDAFGTGEGTGDAYTRKIEAPKYEPKGTKPEASELYDEKKTRAIMEKIEAAKIDPALKSFLIAAAHRHTIFDFENIAEFYAHSDPHVQDLMEDSALVIVDFDKAIEKGFVVFSNHIAEMFDKDNPAHDEE